MVDSSPKMILMAAVTNPLEVLVAAPDATTMILMAGVTKPQEV